MSMYIFLSLSIDSILIDKESIFIYTTYLLVYLYFVKINL